MIISREEFASLTRPLIGIKVARAYQGYGSVVHMDLGRLRPAIGGRLDLKGEVSLMLEWDWRFETDSGIAFGSSSSQPDLATELAELEGQSVVAFSLEGGLPDLVVELSGSLRARSCSCREGDPRWGLWLPDSTWIHCEAGALHYSRMGEGKAEELTEEERAEFDHAEATASVGARGPYRMPPASATTAHTTSASTDPDISSTTGSALRPEASSTARSFRSAPAARLSSIVSTTNKL
jgi:hypothetical protein